MRLPTVMFTALFLIGIGTRESNGAVLLWETKKTEVNTNFGGMLKVNKEEFRKYVEEKYTSMKPTPLLAVFVEETLSVEDLSWKNYKGVGNFPNLKKLTESVENVEFMPRVEDAMSGIVNLKSLGYPTYEIDGGTNLDKAFSCGDVVIVSLPTQDTQDPKQRTNVLRQNDKQICDMFTKMSGECEHSIGVLLGLKTPMIAGLQYQVSEVSASRAPGYLIYQDTRGVGLMVTKFFPNLTHNGYTTLLGVNTTSTFLVTGELVSHNITLNISFDCKYNLTVNFDNLTVGYWYLRTIDVETPDGADSGTIALRPVEDVYAPLGCSFHTAYPLVFKDRKNTTLTFGNLQVQPFFLNPGSKAFGDAVDALPFFTPAILSGLFVMFVLSTIFGWGVIMIMDIRTNSKFDDPNGKGLVIISSDKD